MEKEVSQLHRSKDWGGKPHVDIYIKDELGKVVERTDGCSPTLNPPPMDGNAIILPRIKDLPPPFGNF